MSAPQLSPDELAALLHTFPACGNLTDSLCGITSYHERSYTTIIFVFAALATLVVALRFIARLRTRLPLWWDDCSAVASLSVAVGFTAVCGVYDGLGVGLDLWAVPQDNLSTIFILLEAALLCYIMSRCFVRISICLFLMRIFSVAGARPYIVLGLALNVALSITYLFAIIFQCSPVSFFWTGWDGLHEGTCVHQWALYLAGGVLSTTLDVYYIVLPLWWVLPLQLSRAKKILTAAMLSLGLIVIITSVMRIVTLYKFTHSTNPTRILPQLVIWEGLELDAAIVCACLPSLGPLLKPVGSRLKLWTTRVTKGSSGSSSVPARRYGSQDGGHVKLVDSSNNGGAQLSKRDHGYQSSNIHLTTTILQNQGPPSESDVSLNVHGVELYDRRQGYVQGHVWT
ncbi:hypothetical protein C8A03DRAFT_48425 [Achaetomium macrosporum]|uniref:Rhodopsin domain-containing protein n=1 Tax=Achaetomium macrosporum TaxID=79813 RepID=A0AAN7C061_9PEZI|nr:hypothetical protein C8A03DRAFT_48425 [Achaetomium macrosporum]